MPHRAPSPSLDRLSSSGAWERAATLVERAAALRDMSVKPRPSPRAHAKLAAWRAQAPFEDDAWFARRLAADDLTCAAFTSLLDGAHKTSAAVDWASRIEDAFVDAPRNAQLDLERGLLAFIAPLVDRCRCGFRSALSGLLQHTGALRVDAEALEASLAHTLDQSLLRMLRPTLALELQVARLRDTSCDNSSDASAKRFARFVARLTGPRAALALLCEYPVLARQVQTQLDAWQRSSVELVARLITDAPALIDAGLLAPCPVLLSADLGRGDTHRGGRAVAVLHLSDGAKLVYKPRSLAVDAHFAELLAWVNAHDTQQLVPELRSPRLLDRGSHGWMAFVEAAPCATMDEVARFYARQGALLALVHVLHGTDLHCENIIACGEHPILFDLEALFHQDPEQLPVAADAVAAVMADSVLRVGLLPEPARNGLACHSGLGSGEGKWKVQVPVWKGHGTDQLRRQREYVSTAPTSHRPTFEGEPVSALMHQQTFCAAFDATLALVARHRDALLAPGGAIARFAHDPVRAVLRPTEVYAVLLRETFHPDLLRDAIDREHAFDRLWLGARDRPSLTRVISAERQDLWNGDVPYFSTSASSCDLVTSTGEVIASFFPMSGMQTVINKLEALDQAERARQRWLVQSALTALGSEGDAERLRAKQYVPTVLDAAAAQAAKQDESLVATACALAERLAALALRRGADLEWLGLQFRADRWEIAAAGTSLGEGNLGIALFLAMLGRCAREPSYTELAQEVLTSCLRRLRQSRRPGDEGGTQRIGAFDGHGGLLFTLAHLTKVWDGCVPREAITFALDAIEAGIAHDRDFDVIAGSAGAIRALLAQALGFSDSRAADLAIVCGDHLLAHSERLAGGLAWRHAGAHTPPLGGYAHGSSGIAASLLALARYSGEARFAAAAQGAFAYERSLYCEASRNWRDLRMELGAARCSMSWCNGAPGIGLARVQALRSESSPALEQDLTIAVETTRAEGFGASHCLCHGDLGNLELLFADAERRGCAGSREYATRLASAIANNVRVRPLCGNPHRIETPGLLTGLAGIGYGLLRVVDPQRIPSVLMLDPPPRELG